MDYAVTLYNPEQLQVAVNKYARKLRKLIKQDPEIVALVSTGSSGAILAASLMQRKGLTHLSHSHVSKSISHGQKIRGSSYLSGRAVFVDDFIESGASLRRCLKKFPSQLKYALISYMPYGSNDQVKGVEYHYVIWDD